MKNVIRDDPGMDREVKYSNAAVAGRCGVSRAKQEIFLSQCGSRLGSQIVLFLFGRCHRWDSDAERSALSARVSRTADNDSGMSSLPQTSLESADPASMFAALGLPSIDMEFGTVEDQR